MNVLDSTTVESRIPHWVRYYLAADTTLSGIFGTENIQALESAEFGIELAAPYLAVTPLPLPDIRQTGQRFVADYPVWVTAFLPRPGRINRALSTPGTPALAEGAAGLLTGTYYYAVTGWNGDGESWASERSASITVTAKKITVTIPTVSGAWGRRLWRTKAGRTFPQFLCVIPENTSTSFSDNLPDSHLVEEMAPDEWFGQKLSGAIKASLMTSNAQVLKDSGTLEPLVDGLFGLTEVSDRVIPGKNQRRLVLRVTYGVYADGQTRRSVI